MKNLKSPKLYFQVYDALREYIIKNNLKPGDKMPTEAEMTEALGVSRNVLREGIKTLEIIGVLSSKPGVGMIINSFNSNFLSSCIYQKFDCKMLLLLLLFIYSILPTLFTLSSLILS